MLSILILISCSKRVLKGRYFLIPMPSHDQFQTRVDSFIGNVTFKCYFLDRDLADDKANSENHFHPIFNFNS